MKRRLALFLVIGGAVAPAVGDELSSLSDHLQAFVDANHAGELTFSITPQVTITGDTDLASVAAEIADNAWVLDAHTIGDDFFPPSGFEQLVGVGRGQAISDLILPRLVEGAVVASVSWDFVGQTVTTRAVVAPGDHTPGDLSAIYETVSGMYFVPGPGRASWSKNFYNGFGQLAATYSATLTCVSRVCDPDISCNDIGLGCSADCREQTVCLANGVCKMKAAFVGYCAFPDVKFKNKTFEFEVSGWGWQYFKSTQTLLEDCDCDPSLNTQVSLETQSSDSSAEVGNFSQPVLITASTTLPGPVPAPGVLLEFGRESGTYKILGGFPDVMPSPFEDVVLIQTGPGGNAGLQVVALEPGPIEINVHVTDADTDDSAGFYAFLTGCAAADRAEPFGVLNFFDVAAFIQDYKNQSYSADLSEPFGEWNFFDVAAFINIYLAGCP